MLGCIQTCTLDAKASVCRGQPLETFLMFLLQSLLPAETLKQMPYLTLTTNPTSGYSHSSQSLVMAQRSVRRLPDQSRLQTGEHASCWYCLKSVSIEKIKFVVYFIPQEAFGAVPDIVAHVTYLQAISFHSPSVYAWVIYARLTYLNSVQHINTQFIYRVRGMLTLYIKWKSDSAAHTGLVYHSHWKSSRLNWHREGLKFKGN